MVQLRETIDSKSFTDEEINYIYNMLMELQWEHSWYEKSYEKGELQNQGLPKNYNYNGLAQYCKCFKCRPLNFDQFRIINDTRIKNILK